MKRDPEPYPLIVAITGPQGTQAELTARLAGQLLRRGLRVHAVRNPREKLFSDGDIVLVPCRIEEVSQLAKQIEHSWTQQWISWFTNSEKVGHKK